MHIESIHQKACASSMRTTTRRACNPRADRLRKLLFAIDTAAGLDDLAAFPGWRLHPLKGNLDGFWSLTVTGSWRLIFQYDAVSNTASTLDLIDYH